MSDPFSPTISISKKVGEKSPERDLGDETAVERELAASAVLDGPAPILLVAAALERRDYPLDRPVGQQEADRVEQMRAVVRHRVLDVAADFGELSKRAARDYARGMNEVRMETVLVADRELDARVLADLDHFVDFGHREGHRLFAQGCP